MLTEFHLIKMHLILKMRLILIPGICLLTTIISGYTRLPARFHQSDLVSLGSRIRIRNTMEAYTRETTMD